MTLDSIRNSCDVSSIPSLLCNSVAVQAVVVRLILNKSRVTWRRGFPDFNRGDMIRWQSIHLDEFLKKGDRGGVTFNQARKPRSYASPKLRLTYLLTGVKCRATSVAKNQIAIEQSLNLNRRLKIMNFSIWSIWTHREKRILREQTFWILCIFHHFTLAVHHIVF